MQGRARQRSSPIEYGTQNSYFGKESALELVQQVPRLTQNALACTAWGFNYPHITQAKLVQLGHPSVASRLVAARWLIVVDRLE